jgi:hypothetical protein
VQLAQLQLPQLQLAHSHVAQSQVAAVACSPEAEHAPDG